MRKLVPAGTQAGFSLIELMVSIAIAAILLSLAVPAFNDFQARNALRATASDFIAAVNTARIQAVSLRSPVKLKEASGGWANGWVVEYDASVKTEKKQTFLPRGTSALKSEDGLTEVEFRSNGLTSVGEAKFSLCDDRTGETGRTITISPFGKITNEVKSCS